MKDELSSDSRPAHLAIYLNELHVRFMYLPAYCVPHTESIKVILFCNFWGILQVLLKFLSAVYGYVKQEDENLFFSLLTFCSQFITYKTLFPFKKKM